MTTRVDAVEAQLRLSELLERATNGEDIVITEGGWPRVRLVPVPVPAAREPRRPGAWNGRVQFHQGWDEDLTDHFECLQNIAASEPKA